MTAPQNGVARQSHDAAETENETPVIPLRPGMTEPVRQPSAEPVDVAQRRAEALRLSRDEGLSLRDIGKRLGTSKDTAARDIAIARRDEAQASDATAEEACDTDETSQPTVDTTDETPPLPGDTDRDTLVLVLDEPLRQALAVLRGTRGAPDTATQNRAAARAAIRAMADHITEQAQI